MLLSLTNENPDLLHLNVMVTKTFVE